MSCSSRLSEPTDRGRTGHSPARDIVADVCPRMLASARGCADHAAFPT
jgi:hypothetical protein